MSRTPSDIESLTEKVNHISNSVLLLVETMQNRSFGAQQNSVVSVKDNASSKATWAAVVACIVVSALFYQSNQWYSSQILFLQLENERQKDRNEDYFSMHMNAINQVRAKLDLKLIEPLPKKDEKEAKK